MLQRLSKSHTKVKSCSISENLLQEISQITHSLLQVKKTTKKAQNNKMNSTKILYKMDTMAIK